MIKLIYDLCTATAERRPTTAKDIEKDIHVETFNTEEELLNHVAKLVKYDEDDLADVDGETPLDKVEKIIEWCNDPDDGSPNFLYLSKNGFEIPCCEPYLEIEWMDLERATKEEIVKELQAELNDEEERINREKDAQAERDVIDKELEETPVEQVVGEINSKTLKDVFDYYINLFGQGRMVITQQKMQVIAMFINQLCGITENLEQLAVQVYNYAIPTIYMPNDLAGVSVALSGQYKGVNSAGNQVTTSNTMSDFAESDSQTKRMIVLTSNQNASSLVDIEDFEVATQSSQGSTENTGVIANVILPSFVIGALAVAVIVTINKKRKVGVEK